MDFSGVTGILLFLGVVALALVLATNGAGVASIVGAVSGGYSNMLSAAEGKG